jgi:hypothetical protein
VFSLIEQRATTDPLLRSGGCTISTLNHDWQLCRMSRDIDRRVRCQHVIGHQRGVAVRFGGCGMRTGADGDHMQHASIGSDRSGLSDIMNCLALLCSATARAAAAEVCETGEQLEVERSMLSEIRARSGMHHRLARATTVADLRCRSRCAVQLRPRFPTTSDGSPTLYA